MATFKWNIIPESAVIKVVNEVVCGVHPLPPCTFLGLRPSYVTGIGALTTMYVGSEQCSYFAYFEQSTEHRYIISSGQGSYGEHTTFRTRDFNPEDAIQS